MPKKAFPLFVLLSCGEFVFCKSRDIWFRSRTRFACFMGRVN